MTTLLARRKRKPYASDLSRKSEEKSKHGFLKLGIQYVPLAEPGMVYLSGGSMKLKNDNAATALARRHPVSHTDTPSSHVIQTLPERSLTGCEQTHNHFFNEPARYKQKHRDPWRAKRLGEFFNS